MKKVLFMVVALSLLLSACSGGGGGEGEETSLTNPFIGGTVGLNMYLLEGLPPSVIHDNGQFPFSFAVVLENLGEADVGPQTDNPFVNVSIEGINPIQWNLDPAATDQQLISPLRGARKNFDGTILPGEITTMSYEGLNYLPNIRGNVEYVLRAEVCYDYLTLSSTLLCIKDDVLENLQDETICSLTGEKNPQNSGGPVQITSLVQQPLSNDKIQVNFVIEHVGIGEFYGRGANESCDPSVRNFNKHWVHVRLAPLSDPDIRIRCPRFAGLSQGDVKLFQGAPQTISCEIENTAPSTGRVYQDLLEIELRYRYGQFIETPILVQDVSNEAFGALGANCDPRIDANCFCDPLNNTCTRNWTLP